jgi:hypothetical protein
MARFYAEIQGNRGAASRMGTPNSGLSGHIRGWDVGVRVDCAVEDNDEDVIRVFRTAGSNGGRSDELIAELRSREGRE